MRITVDLSPALQHHAGVGRFTEELARALWVSRLADEEFLFFGVDSQQRTPAALLADLPYKNVSWPNKVWRAGVAMGHYLGLASDALIGPSDLFLATDHVLPHLLRTASVFVLYDLSYLIVPETHSLLNRTYLQYMMPRFLKTAQAVITISHASRQDILNYYSISANKVHVVYGGVSSQFKPVTNSVLLETVRERYQLPPKFILYLGTLEPRKNILSLLQAFQQASLVDMHLVLAGKRGWLYAELIHEIQKAQSRGRVHELGFVPDEDLPALYTLATAFAFPSRHEGFGLPVLEALACGLPVVASNTSSLPEITGNAALLVPPSDIPQWINALEQVTQNETLRVKLSSQALQQAAKFTWERAATQTREIYRDAYAHFMTRFL